MAANNLGVTTLHSRLGFKFGSDMLDLAPQKLDMARKYLENIEVFIVDKMSPVSSDNLYNLNKRLQDLIISEDNFGGKCALFIGDILQLPPFRAPAIFLPPRNFESLVLFESLELNLWENVQSVLLTETFRQGQGPWVKMLTDSALGKQLEKISNFFKGDHHLYYLKLNTMTQIIFVIQIMKQTVTMIIC